MPELPEVENVVDALRQSVVGYQIASIELLYPKLVEIQSLPLSKLENRIILNVQRRGKYVIFVFDNDLFLVSHLRMEGRYYISESNKPLNKHSHCLFHFTNHWTMQYLDTRKFGRICLTDNLDAFFTRKGLGLEPFDEKLDKEWLYHRLQRHKRAIKTSLLDQSIVVGIGNIYADEILFKTRINPQTISNHISLKKCADLVDVIKQTLSEAILQGGTTIRSFEISQHVTGLFQVNLVAYGRYGKPCLRCGHTMERIIVGGRSSSFCPVCQRKR